MVQVAQEALLAMKFLWLPLCFPGLPLSLSVKRSGRAVFVSASRLRIAGACMWSVTMVLLKEGFEWLTLVGR
jgi:hypothetical protein